MAGMADGDDDVGNDLAKWLQESGRRRPEHKADTPADTAANEAPPPAHPWRTLRLLLLLAVAAVAFLWYFYADVLLTIYKLRSVIVFIFEGR